MKFLLGAHLTMTAVEAILKSDDLQEFVKNGSTFNISPLEFKPGYSDHLTWKRPRIVHTHLKYNMLPLEISQNKGKVIHVMRNPADVAVSYYHFALKNVLMGPFTGTWNAFFEAYMAGRVGLGKWDEHVANWLKYRGESNVLFIKYEDFLREPKKMISKIAKFFDKMLTDDKIKQVTEIISFQTMKSNPKLNPTHETVKGDILRKGIIGDWLNYFTPEQKDKLDQMYNKFTAETGEEFCFK